MHHLDRRESPDVLTGGHDGAGSSPLPSRSDNIPMARMPVLCAWMLAALAVGLCCAPSIAAEPTPLRRLVAGFDFEGEQETGQELPRGWYKSAIPSRLLPPEVRFPHYVKGKLTDQAAHSGKMSFSMTLDGGNVAYTYTDGLDVFPDSDYLVTGWVRVAALRVARAQVRVFLVDRRGEPIPGKASVGEPMGEPGGKADGRWQQFQVVLRGSDRDAMRLQITLSLVQPEIWQPIDQQALDQQDIDGTCWWDDIAVYRIPRVSVTAAAPANVFAPGVRPALKAHLEGLDPVDTNVVLTVRSPSSAVRVMRILQPPNPGASPVQDLLLPDLPPGLYTAELAVSAAGEELQRATCRFAVLGDLPLGSAGQLELDGSHLDPEQWPALLAVAQHLRAGGVKLPAWPSVPGNVHDVMSAMLSRVHDRGLTATLVMDGVPPMPDTTAPPRTLIAGMADPTKELADAVSLAIARHASRASYWQLGSGRDERDLWNPDLAAAYRTGREWTQRLLATEGLMLGWNAMYEYNLPSPPRLSVRIPSALAPDQIPGQLATFARQVDQVHLVGQPGDMDGQARVADFALRYGYTRAAGLERISIDPPWQVSADGRIEPTELFLVVRTLAAYLGNATCLGAARLDESTAAMIFGREDAEGVMLMYRQGGGDDNGEIRMDLPPGAYGVDLWGRRYALQRDDGRVVLRPRAAPTLIAGCDATTLALRSSVRFEPATLNSTYTEHAGRIHFINPYSKPAAGTLRLTGPAGWSIQPRVKRFSVGPGDRWSQAVTIRFPYSATTGLKRINVALDIETAGGGQVEIPAFLHLSLPEITFDPIYALGEDGQLQVQMCVINNGDQPITFRCFAHVAGRARQSSIVQDLPAGAKTVKIFRFSDGAALLGQTLRSGLRQIDGNAVLNHTIEIR